MGAALLAACSAGGDAGEPRPEAARGSAPEAAAEPVVAVGGFDAVEPFLAEHRGEGTLLNFWAIWCGPCVAELPELVEAAEAWRDRGGRVVGISYDLMVPGAEREGIEATMRAFMAKKGMDWPILIYDEDDYEALNERFELFGEVPVTLALDAEGNVVDRQRGRADRARFDEMMAKALGQGS